MTASKNASSCGLSVPDTDEVRSIPVTMFGYPLLAKRIACDSYCAAEPAPPWTKTIGSAGSWAAAGAADWAAERAAASAKRPARDLGFLIASSIFGLLRCEARAARAAEVDSRAWGRGEHPVHANFGATRAAPLVSGSQGRPRGRDRLRAFPRGRLGALAGSPRDQPRPMKRRGLASTTR